MRTLRPGSNYLTLPGSHIRFISPRGGAAAEWWNIGTPVAAYNAIGAASKVLSYKNLANPYTYDARPPGGPTWDTVNGWTFTAASSHYLITGVTPTANYTVMVRFSSANLSGINICAFGAFTSSTDRFDMFQATAADARIYHHGGVLNIASGETASGTMAIAAQEAYLNGASDGTIASASSNTRAAYIGARNEGASPGNYYDGKIQAIAIYSDTLTAGEVAALHTSINALGANWWVVAGKTCVAAYQPKGASSYAHSLTNLANPGTYDATAPTGPSWANGTGWTCSGSTQYLLTGIANLAVEWSAMIRFSGLGAGLQTVMGAYVSVTENFYIMPNSGGGQRRYNNAGQRAVSGAQTAATMAFASKDAYLNGVSDGTIAAGSTTCTQDLYIGALNFGDSPLQYTVGNIQALYIGSATLTAPQVATLHASMMALT